MTQVSFDHFFATLSNAQRLQILRFLNTDGPKSVTDIAESLGIEQSAVSHALKKLLLCHFVEVAQSGKERIYTVNVDTITPLLKQIEIHVDKYCAENCKH